MNDLIIKHMTAILAESGNTMELSADSSFVEMGMDSNRMMRLFLELMNEIELDIPTIVYNWEAVKTIEDLAKLITN